MAKKKEKLPLIESNSKLANEAYGWETNKYIPVNTKVDWRCDKKHIWNARIADRIKGQGCAVCAGKQINIGVNDLSTTHPIIASEALNWDPKTITKSSNKKMQWKCKLGHIFTSTPNNRTRNTANCPICSGKTLLVGFNDLKTKFPKIAKEANGWNPANFLAGSNSRQSWKCDLGHEWKTSISTRVHQNTDCPTCKGKKIVAQFNSLGALYPELASEASGWNPFGISPGSHLKKEWKCKLGHSWSSQIKSRVSGTGCPICSNKKLLKGFNDLATTHPQISRESYGWDPSMYIAGHNKKMNWKCELGHIWMASPNKRTSGNRGCPSCAKTSFDPNADGWLYLIYNDKSNLLKIGITNKPKVRVGLHISRGWEVIDLRGPLDGKLAKSWEKSIIDLIRRRSKDKKFNYSTDKFDGYTESWHQEVLKVNTIKELMNMVEDFEN